MQSFGLWRRGRIEYERVDAKPKGIAPIAFGGQGRAALCFPPSTLPHWAAAMLFFSDAKCLTSDGDGIDWTLNAQSVRLLF